MKKSLFAIAGLLCGLLSLSANETILKTVTWNRKDAVQKKGDSFLMVKNGLIHSVEKFKVDPKATYKITLKMRKSSAQVKDFILSVGFASLRANGNVISSPEVELFAGTETELSADTVRGSKIIYVKDVSKWPQRTQAHVLAFNAKPGYKDLPNNFFSGNIDKIVKKDGMYELTVRYPMYRVLKKGTPVRLHRHAAGRNYCVRSMRFKSTEWVTLSGTIKGIAPKGAVTHQWWNGTVNGCIAMSLPKGVEFKDVLVEKITAPVKK